MHKTLYKDDTMKIMYFEQPEGSGHFLLVVKNAKLYSHDFAGDRSNFKTRSICVEIPEEVKDILINDGWEVKVRIYEVDDREPRYYLPVKIQFNEYGPEIKKIGDGDHTLFTEETANTLDDCSMTNINLVISPYKSDRKATLSAYLREMRFQLNKSPLDFDDYDDEDDLPFN